MTKSKIKQYEKLDKLYASPAVPCIDQYILVLAIQFCINIAKKLKLLKFINIFWQYINNIISTGQYKLT